MCKNRKEMVMRLNKQTNDILKCHQNPLERKKNNFLINSCSNPHHIFVVNFTCTSYAHLAVDDTADATKR